MINIFTNFNQPGTITIEDFLFTEEKRKLPDYPDNESIERVSHFWFNSQDLISNSPYYLPYNSCDVSSENLVLDQLIIPKLIFFFILITYLVDIVLIL